jgi:hypothetical protein
MISFLSAVVILAMSAFVCRRSGNYFSIFGFQINKNVHAEFSLTSKARRATKEINYRNWPA